MSETERERQKKTAIGRGHAGKERKRGSRGEWKRDGSIYRLLSSDASGITFVRFAGVDDVVARGVGVISTREGTYLPITVRSLFPSYAHIRTHLYSPSLPSLSLLFIYSTEHIPELRSPTRRSLVREFRSEHRHHESLSLSRGRSLDFYLYPNLYGDTSGTACIRN